MEKKESSYDLTSSLSAPEGVSVHELPTIVEVTTDLKGGKTSGRMVFLSPSFEKTGGRGSVPQYTFEKGGNVSPPISNNPSFDEESVPVNLKRSDSIPLDVINFFESIQAGNDEEVESILKKSPNLVEVMDLSGRRPIHVCCQCGTFEMFLLISNYETDFNVIDRNGWTPLHFACSAGKLDIVDRLLELKADIHKINKLKNLPLHYLVRVIPFSKSQRALLLKLLKKFIVEKKGKVNAQNSSGDTALHGACHRGDFDVIKFLLDCQADPNIANKNGETSLHAAARRGDKKILKLLLKKGADALIEGSQGSPIQVAAPELKPELEKYSKKTIVKKNVVPPVPEVAINKDDIFKELQLYAEKGDYVAFAELLQKNAIQSLKGMCRETDESGKTLLMVASYQGNNKMASIFVKEGSDVNARDHSGKTALHYACNAIADSSEVIELLLGQTAVNVNLVDEEQATPLHYLCKNKSMDPNDVAKSVEKFVKMKGSNVNALNKHQETPLHFASRAGLAPVVSMLLKLKANINAQRLSSETPLHMAILMGNTEIIKILVEGGADLSLGLHTALELAMQQDLPDEIIILLGGKPAQKKRYGKDRGALFNQILTQEQSDNPATVEFQMYSWLLDPNEIEFLGELGEGRFAKVYKGKFRLQTVAIKVLKNVNKIDEIKKEFDILRSMRSPHIVYFYGLAIAPREVSLVMQFCGKGALNDVLRNNDFPLDWGLCLKWCSQITTGVRDLHGWKPQILHRDLKTLNILVDENLNCFVSDFGVSRFVIDENQTTLGKMRGTYAYSAPEIYYNQPASEKSDIYALGIMFWEIANRCVTGEWMMPFSEFKSITMDFQIIIQVAKVQARPTIPPSCPELFKHLIQKAWAQSPESRPSTVEILDELKKFRVVSKDWDTKKETKDTKETKD